MTMTLPLRGLIVFDHALSRRIDSVVHALEAAPTRRARRQARATLSALERRIPDGALVREVRG